MALEQDADSSAEKAIPPKEPLWPIAAGLVMPGLVYILIATFIKNSGGDVLAFLLKYGPIILANFAALVAADAVALALLTNRGVKRSLVMACSMQLWKISGFIISSYLLFYFIAYFLLPLVAGHPWLFGLLQFLFALIPFVALVISFIAGLGVIELVHKVEINAKTVFSLIASEIIGKLILYSGIFWLFHIWIWSWTWY